MLDRPAFELRIDRIDCDGYGMCAELLPELIELDDWGYPIVRKLSIPPDLLGHARRAAAACPVLALKLEARTRAVAGVPGAPERVRSAAGG
jgi:ferredoxin